MERRANLFFPPSLLFGESTLNQLTKKKRLADTQKRVHVHTKYRLAFFASTRRRDCGTDCSFRSISLSHFLVKVAEYFLKIGTALSRGGDAVLSNVYWR